MPNSATQRLCTPTDPTAVKPTEVEIAEALTSGWFEGMDKFGKYGPQFDPLSAARAVLALFEGVGR